MGVEGPEDGAFRGVGGLGVVDCVDEEREAKDVREKNKLLWVVSYGFFPVLAVICRLECNWAYMPHITADLPSFDEEI